MRGLVLAMLLAAGPAGAECPGPGGPAPRTVTFADGSAVRDLRREGDAIGYETRHPEIGAIRSTAHLAIFPLATATRHGATRHVWTGALPPAAALAPGARFEHRGVLVGAAATALPVRIAVEVGARGEVRLGGCLFRTLTVTSRMTIGDQPEITVVRDLDPATLVVLRALTTRPAGGGHPAIRQESRAVRVE